ncbi:hypothetical protein PCANC_13886 [Puccinia coronata f. sp. avenae]|uniref:Uncharacterized protein n=1 Tax=Puccinia coronata f. sp. avenae TaxID=200324 RepID=A0A2N5SPS4_9BASI|nr:hypothetical protein PCANC_13886 [Puccinia coronata f. sp. avenae]
MNHRKHQERKRIEQVKQQKKREAIFSQKARDKKTYSDASDRLASMENAKAFDRRAQLASRQTGPDSGKLDRNGKAIYPLQLMKCEPESQISLSDTSSEKQPPRVYRTDQSTALEILSTTSTLKT